MDHATGESSLASAQEVEVNSGERQWRVRMRPGQLIAERGPAPHPTVQDVAGAVRAAIAEPLDFPPLEHAVYPGDRVVFAVDGSPQAFRPLLIPLVEMAIRRGARPDDVVILAPSRAKPAAEQGPAFPVRVEYHDPTDPARLCYLASTEEGERIYLNRTLVDADVVIVVGAVRYDPILGVRGTASGLFPALSTADSYERMVHSFTGQRLGHHTDSARKYVDQVAWLLGLQIAVQVVQGRGGEVVGVLAGQVDSVQKQATQLLDACCRVQVPRRADAVLVSVTKRGRQTVADLARALHVASRVVRRHGDIIVLSDVAGELGPTLTRARSMDSPSDVLTYLRGTTPADAVTAFLIAGACRHARVHLASGLDDDVVEELFMFPIDDEKHVERVLGRSESCIVLHEANLLTVDVEE